MNSVYNKQKILKLKVPELCELSLDGLFEFVTRCRLGHTGTVDPNLPGPRPKYRALRTSVCLGVRIFPGYNLRTKLRDEDGKTLIIKNLFPRV